MHSYGVRDVEKLLRLPRRTIRALVAAGFVTPAKGAQRELRFSFQDLIVLRTAQALADAKVPARRITESLREIRRQLPESMPLSGLSIGAVGKRVVVKDGTGQRHVDSGQYLLAFEGDPAKGSLSVIEKKSGGVDFSPGTRAGADEPGEKSTPTPSPHSADDWFDEAAELEGRDPDAAVQAYENAVAADPGRVDARVNLGRLLHETGKLVKAERVYRKAIADCGPDPILLYNLGVLLEDLEREPEAIAAYERALRGNPTLADCHYNLALLCERHRKPRDAIRHMAQYRRLTATRS